MGGFHGGHSGGHSSGGFHGGSSHHSSSYHGSSSSTVVRQVHTVKDGKHYVNGNRYYGAWYGMGFTKPFTFIGKIVSATCSIIFGLLCFLLIYTVPKDATVTNAYKSYDSEQGMFYEQYDFDYKFKGVTYHGYGDDDLNSDGTFNVLVGETYQIHVHYFNPSNYEFSNYNGVAVGALIIFEGLGAVIIITSISTKRKYEKYLREIGDVNNDGILNEEDIKYHEQLNEAKEKGASKAMEENAYIKERSKLVCPYCQTPIKEEFLYCPSCGASLGNLE